MFNIQKSYHGTDYKLIILKIQTCDIYQQYPSLFFCTLRMMGFAQVAKLQEVERYFLRGKQIAQKHMDFFIDTNQIFTA